jgi:hypothetical protein
MANPVVDIEIGATDQALLKFYGPGACLPVEVEDRRSR